MPVALSEYQTTFYLNAVLYNSLRFIEVVNSMELFDHNHDHSKSCLVYFFNKVSNLVARVKAKGYTENCIAFGLIF